jgi:nucleoside-diphosphate-sugar epimerase
MLTPRLDAVFHLAALIGIPYSYQAPQQYVQTNIQGTLNVLEACLRSGIGRLVQTSTSEVYGTAQYAPIDENHPLQGQSPYSATKIAADKLAESYFCSFQLPVTVLRPFNTFGPRQSARAFIPSMISQALAADELHVGDLTPCRDLLYVSDTVAGFMAAALSPHTVGQTVHIGTGQTHAMSEVLQTILKLLGKPNLAVITDTARLRPDGSEVRLLQCNPQLAKEWMNWQATVSLEEGLQQTIETIQANLANYKPLLYAR